MKHGRKPELLEQVKAWFLEGNKGTTEECIKQFWGGNTSPGTWYALSNRVRKSFRDDKISFGVLKHNGDPGVYQIIKDSEDAGNHAEFNQKNIKGRSAEAIAILKLLASNFPDELPMLDSKFRELELAWSEGHIAILQARNEAEKKVEA